MAHAARSQQAHGCETSHLLSQYYVGVSVCWLVCVCVRHVARTWLNATRAGGELNVAKIYDHERAAPRSEQGNSLPRHRETERGQNTDGEHGGSLFWTPPRAEKTSTHMRPWWRTMKLLWWLFAFPFFPTVSSAFSFYICISARAD